MSHDLVQVASWHVHCLFCRFDNEKGFYCRVAGRKTKCLGKGKGRDYPEMAEDADQYLTKFYSAPNRALALLLSDHGYQIPKWLSNYA